MFGILMFFFIIVCLFLALVILIQQGKGDMGLGSLGGSAQMLFGGSGGQELFEKITWVLGAIFLFGSLGLAVLKSKEVRESRIKGFTAQRKNVPASAPVAAESTMTEPIEEIPVLEDEPLASSPSKEVPSE